MARSAWCGYAWSVEQLSERLNQNEVVIMRYLCLLESRGLVRREPIDNKQALWHWAGDRPDE